MIRVLILTFLGIFMVHMSDGSECTNVWLGKTEAINASPKQLVTKAQEMCQTFSDYKSCLNRGPAEDRQLTGLSTFKSLDESCINLKCIENCTKVIKPASSFTSIKEVCSAYNNYKSCIDTCPNGKEVWLMAASNNRKIVDSFCTNENQRRYRRELSNQLLEAISEFGNRLPDHQMNIFDDINQMKVLVK